MSGHAPEARSGDREIRETAEEARQGRPGRPVWFVLAISTALAALILGILVLFFAGTGEATVPASLAPAGPY